MILGFQFVNQNNVGLDHQATSADVQLYFYNLLFSSYFGGAGAAKRVIKTKERW